MNEQLLSYFAAEKQESLLFILVAVVSCIVSLFLWNSNSDYKAMLYPLIAVGVIQLIVGGSVYVRTDAQVKTFTAQLHATPDQFLKDELLRMRAVNANFKIYKAIEILLLTAGIVLSYVYANTMTWYSVAIGLIVQSSTMLVFDLFAERRAHEYVAALERMLLWAPY